MNAALEPFERRLSGTTRVFLAFVTGAMFALLPMYYVYTGRDAAVPAAPAVAPPLAGASNESVGVPPAGTQAAAATSDHFAARMTYELSAPSADAPATLQSAPPASARAAASVEPAAAASPARAIEDRAGGRIANARPINTTPPELRDTTREIEKEARRADYREPQRPVGKTGGEVQPRVVEGKDLVLPPKPAVSGTRAIGAGPIAPSAEVVEGHAGRKMIDSAVAFMASQDRRMIESPAGLAGGLPLAGSMPIGSAPDTARAEAPVRTVTAPVAAEAARSSAPDMDGRFAATREWLTAAPQTTHTIQILGTTSEEQLKAQLKSLSRVLEPSRLYMYRTTVQGKPGTAVLYGDYPDRRAAQEALEKLPSALSANRPVVRALNGIRAEQKQHAIKSEP